jgi:hypothetical protein
VHTELDDVVVVVVDVAVDEVVVVSVEEVEVAEVEDVVGEVVMEEEMVVMDVVT